MLNFFKKKREVKLLISVLNLSNVDFVKKVSNSIELGSGAMLAAAYLNTTTLLSVSEVSLEDYIKLVVPHCISQDELKERRFTWFYLAALIRRAGYIAKGNPELENMVASIWVIVAEGCRNIYDKLKNNILWSDEEKIWFDILKGCDEVEGIDYCIKHIMPSWLLKNTIIIALKDKYNII
jgi:hypothetical protein